MSDAPTVGTTNGSDSSVQSTNDDAQISKLSCSQLGYFKDDFIRFFVKKAGRRSPLINRGYYSRIASLRLLLHRFLDCGDPGFPKQVLSLGAGFDTTWFQFKSEGKAPTRYVEVDFKEVTSRKASLISKTTELQRLFGEQDVIVDTDEGSIVSSGYCLLPADLRHPQKLSESLQSVGFDFEAPTYVLSECVLVYMEPQESAALVAWLGKHLSNAVMVVYEQIRPDDAFGKQMMMNLQSRGCSLKGLRSTPTLEAHKARMTNNGWSRALAQDMDTIYKLHLDPADKRRIERLEIFDEFEEWHMIQEHYCITIGINDKMGVFDKFSFPEFPVTLPARKSATALGEG